MLKLQVFKYNPDKRFLFQIRDQFHIRKKFFNSKKNSFIEHLIWINKNYKNNIIFIINSDNKKIGYIRYKKEKNSYEISIAIEKKIQGKGISKEALKMSEKFLKSKIIKSKVLKNNRRSLNFFKSCDYKVQKSYQTFIELIKILK